MKLRARVYATFFALGGFTAGVQQSFATSFSASDLYYDAGLFTPFQDLSALSFTEHTTLRHPHFPAHGVRIKQSRFCDGEVKTYSGYIDIEARHLFFTLFESRHDPEADDIIFWTNGGPGGSSIAGGLFGELGACRITGPNTTERFEHAWNNNANVFFVDQPIGVGYSYADYGEQVGSVAEAGKDIAAFVAIFFEHFTKFKGRGFHMAGESYGGRYIPVYASAVYDLNSELIQAGLTPINLTSVMIGNGDTNTKTFMLSIYDVQCENYGFPKITSISECLRMKQLVPRCEKRLQESCLDILDRIDCLNARDFCDNSFSGIFSKVNPYNALIPCTDNPDLLACYPIIADANVYLQNPSVHEVLGIDPQHANFSWINWDVNRRLTEDDVMFRAEHFLEALLTRGVKALIYVGDADWSCNWVGNERMTLELEWFGQHEYRSKALRDWFVDGAVAGRTRSAGGLTFATVRDAGHMVPYDQPVRALHLVNRWLAGREL